MITQEMIDNRDFGRKIYLEGDYDNGCFTFTGNDLVHYLLNTLKIFHELELAYERAFIHMKSNHFYDYRRFRECLKEHKLYKFNGDISYLLNRIRWIYETTKKAYIKEFGNIEMSDLEFEIVDDFRCFLIRYYSFWVYDNKK